MFAAWCAVVAAAVALSVWVAIDGGALPGEERAVHEVQGWRFPGQPLTEFVRGVTTTQVVVICGYALAAALFVTGARREGVVLAVLMLVLPFAQSGMKEIVDRARPPADEFDWRGSVTSESYPAGHVMSPTVLYGYVLWLCAWLRWPRALRAAGAAWAAFMLALAGIVNVWAGVHWPTDAIGGYLWAAVLVLPAAYAASRGRAR